MSPLSTILKPQSRLPPQCRTNISCNTAFPKSSHENTIPFPLQHNRTLSRAWPHKCSTSHKSTWFCACLSSPTMSQWVTLPHEIHRSGQESQDVKCGPLMQEQISTADTRPTMHAIPPKGDAASTRYRAARWFGRKFSGRMAGLHIDTVDARW